MAVTWKEVALANNVPNLGNSDLKSDDIVRNFTLKQRAGATDSISFNIAAGGTNTTISPPPLSIVASGFTVDGNTTPAISQTYAGTNLVFQATTQLSFNSDVLWSVTAPYPAFTCDDVIVTNHDVDAAEGPLLTLRRQPNPDDVGANNDLLGAIRFQGENSINGLKSYASLHAKSITATNNAEDGELDIKLMSGGYHLSALTVLPRVANTDIGKLDSLEVYERTLKDLLIGFQKFAMKSTYKMYIHPQSPFGFDEGKGYVAALTPGQDTGTNPNYVIDASTMNGFTLGNTTLDGVQGHALSSYQDTEDVGYGDAWLTYEQLPSCPAMTIEISGHVWWKPRYDPPSGQSISIWYAHEQIEGGLLTDIDADTGIAFAFKGETSTMVLSDGNEVTKLPFSFTQNIAASTSNTIEHMFLLGNEIKTTVDAGYLGQTSAANETNNRNNMVMDVTIRAYPQ